MKLSLIFFLSALTSLYAQTRDVQYYYTEARTAQKAKEYKKFYELILEAHKLHPYHQGILYHVGLASALTNRPEEAIGFLARAIQIQAGYDLHHENLTSLQSLPDFQKLIDLQKKLKTPVIHSDTAFTINNKRLHIESITQTKSGEFFLGSIHQRKIVRSDGKGNFSDFTTNGKHGMTSVFGLKVDQSEKYLWACASPLPEMENFDTLAQSAIYKFEIKTGTLVDKFEPNDSIGHIFGDLTISPAGNIFISDTKTNIIYTVNEKTKTLDEYFTSKEFWNIQGITFSEDGKSMFISDYIKGIFKLETESETLRALKSSLPESLKSIDGLTYYNQSLIAIQNAVSPMRVMQYLLNPAQDEIIQAKIIDQGHPAFNEPTLGSLSGNSFYYIANSLWSGYNEDHSLKPEKELQNVIILKVDLQKLEK
jgi:hypothetical protein